MWDRTEVPLKCSWELLTKALRGFGANWSNLAHLTSFPFAWFPPMLILGGNEVDKQTLHYASPTTTQRKKWGFWKVWAKSRKKKKYPYLPSKDLCFPTPIRFCLWSSTNNNMKHMEWETIFKHYHRVLRTIHFKCRGSIGQGRHGK